MSSSLITIDRMRLVESSWHQWNARWLFEAFEDFEASGMLLVSSRNQKGCRQWRLMITVCRPLTTSYGYTYNCHQYWDLRSDGAIVIPWKVWGIRGGLEKCLSEQSIGKLLNAKQVLDNPRALDILSSKALDFSTMFWKPRMVITTVMVVVNFSIQWFPITVWTWAAFGSSSSAASDHIQWRIAHSAKANDAKYTADFHHVVPEVRKSTELIMWTWLQWFDSGCAHGSRYLAFLSG